MCVKCIVTDYVRVRQPQENFAQRSSSLTSSWQNIQPKYDYPEFNYKKNGKFFFSKKIHRIFFDEILSNSAESYINHYIAGVW